MQIEFIEHGLDNLCKRRNCFKKVTKILQKLREIT